VSCAEVLVVCLVLVALVCCVLYQLILHRFLQHSKETLQLLRERQQCSWRVTRESNDEGEEER
jgi:hypothetical protein